MTLLFFGAAYCQSYNILPDNHISNFASEWKEKVVIKGRIVDDPVTSDAFYGKKRTAFVIQSQGLEKWGQSHSPSNRRDGTVPIFPVTGLVRVSVYNDRELKNIGFGDEVLMEGKLSKPHGLKNPGLFDYVNYLRIKNIYAVLSATGSDSIRVIRDSPIQPFDKSSRLWFDLLTIPRTIPSEVEGILSLSKYQHGIGAFGTVPISALQRWTYLIRHRIRDAITKYTDKPYSGFLKAILIGDRSALESAITDDFVKTGTVHVLAISGLHIGLVAAIFLFVFKLLRIPRRFNLIFTAVILVFYSFIAGSNPPVIRATIIFVVFVLGYIINREPDILNSLSIAAFLILIWNPKELFDPSFQLSFASVLAIILFAPKIEAILGSLRAFVASLLRMSPSSRKAPQGLNYITKSASVSIAATAGVLPIVAGYFNIISPIAIIANLVIIPALFIITTLSFVFLFLYFTGLNILSAYTGALTSVLVRATFFINNIISRAPLAYFRVPAPSLSFVILYYAAVFSFFFLPRKRQMLIPLLLITNLIVWNNILNPERKLLRITVLDVGQGDSILLEFPDNKTMLIDAGSGGIDGDFDIGKNVVAPYLWNKGIRRLDALIITHFHEDHMGGALYLLKNFDIGCAMDSGIVPTEDNGFYDRYKEIIFKKGIRRLTIADREEITGFNDSRLYVINPPVDSSFSDPNDNSVVIKLKYKNFSALFCGDISSNAMDRIIPYGELLKSDILKVPHHGGSIGKESVAVRFFEEVSPKISVISSGARPYSRDSSEANYFFNAINYNTRFNGAVNIVTDGSDFEVRPFVLVKGVRQN